MTGRATAREPAAPQRPLLDLAAGLARVRAGLGVGSILGGAVAILGALAIAILVGAATATNLLVPVVGGAAAILVVVISLRWPVAPLLAVAFLIPIEEVVVLGPLGSLSRYAEILLIVAYAVPRLGFLPIRAMPLAGYGYVTWAAASLIWAIDRNQTVQELPILALLFATAIVVAAYVVEHPEVVRPILWMYTISATGMALLGLVTYLSTGVFSGPNDRATALADQNPAYYAAALLPAFVFCLSEFLSGRRVLITGPFAVISAAAIAASGTRAAWLAAILVVLFFILPRLAPRRRIMAITLIAAVAIGAVQIPGLANVVISRADIALSTGGAGRTDIWTVGLTIYQSAPLTGVGLADFSAAYTPERVRASDVGVYSQNNPAYRAPHNIFIGTLGELGPIGLLLLGALLLPLVFRRGWGPEAGVVQGVFASLVFTSFFLDILNRKQFWLFAAIACGLLYLAEHERARDALRRTAARLGRADPVPSLEPGPPRVASGA